MELTGLNITLRRIQAIESRFNELSRANDNITIDRDFQRILDASMSSNTNAQTNTQKTQEIPQTPFADKIFSSIKAPQPLNPEKAKPNIDNLIETYAKKHNLDCDFVKAVIKQESGFQPEVTSHCGAMGLMQLMPATATEMGVKNAFNPEENIAGGTKYLRGLLDQFEGNKELALAAYNAGPGAVQRYGGIPPYNETQNYVKNVLSHYDKYKSGGQN